MSVYEVLDDRFRACAAGDQQLELLAAGCRWAEGPLYVPAGRYAIWSDIPNDRLLRWDETDGAVSTFRQPAGYVNGNTLDRQGRLVSCEQGNRRVTRTEHDGSVTVLADRSEGQRLNSPNDAAVSSDGADLVHRPRFRDHQRLRGPPRRQRDRRLQRVPDRPRGRRGRRRRRGDARPERHRVQRRRAHPVRLRQPRQRGARLRRRARRADPRRPACVRLVGNGELRQHPARRSRPALGGGRSTTACTATTRTARCSGGSVSRSSSPTSASPARSATACSSPPPRRSTRSSCR